MAENWRHFAASSYQANKPGPAVPVPSFPLRDALVDSTGNMSNSSGNSAANVGAEPPVKASFFISSKNDAMTPPPKTSISSGLSPPNKAHFHHYQLPVTTTATRSSCSTVTEAQLRDIALKHIFQPEVVANSHNVAMLRNNHNNNNSENYFSVATAAKSKWHSSSSSALSETATVSSLGITPLSTAPLRVALRRRLGLSLMARGVSSSPAGVSRSATSPSSHHDDDEDESALLHEMRHESRAAADLLRCIGARALLKKEIASFAQQRPEPAATKNNRGAVPNDQQQQQQRNNDDDEMMPCHLPEQRAVTQQKDDEDDSLLRAARTKNISDAAMARIRHMLHDEQSSDAKNVNSSNNNKYDVEELQQQQQRRQQQPQHKKQPDKKAVSPPPRKIAAAAAADNNKSALDTSQEFHIVGQQHQQQQPSSWLAVERKDGTKETTAAAAGAGKLQQRPQTAEVKRTAPSLSNSTPISSPAAKHNNNNNKPAAASWLSDRTGDFRGPLNRAREGLYRLQISSQKETSTARFLQSKFDSLRDVASVLEAEETNMRLAMAAALSEIVALKKLEEAAQAEAFTWIEHSEDRERRRMQREQEQEHDHREDTGDDEQDFVAGGAANAAETFLLELQM